MHLRPERKSHRHWHLVPAAKTDHLHDNIPVNILKLSLLPVTLHIEYCGWWLLCVFSQVYQSTHASLKPEIYKIEFPVGWHSILKFELGNTSGSANLGDSPTTNTKFLCTTLTFAKCFLFSVAFCFFCWSFWRFSALIRCISWVERGLKSAGFSG